MSSTTWPTSLRLDRSPHVPMRHIARGALVASVAIVALVSLTVGQVSIPLGDVLRALVSSNADGEAFVVQSFRLPRVVVAIFAGIAFGIAGLVLQVLARNPLASPDVIGINAGAGVGAVAVTVAAVSMWGGVTVAALIGALVAGAILYALSWRDGVTGERMVLMGIAVAAAGAGLILYLTTRAKAFDAQKAIAWLTGSLNGRNWEDVAAVIVPCLLLIPVVLLLKSQLRLLALGDDVSRSLGMRVESTRLALYTTSVVLCAGAVAAAGPVAFVALMAPHVARRIRRDVIPLFESALCGALMMVLADLVGRLLFAPIELPVGVVTGVAGAPLLLLLLSRGSARAC